MAPLVTALSQTRGIESVVCVTGQHRQMLDQVMELFGLQARHDLAVGQHRHRCAGHAVRPARCPARARPRHCRAPSLGGRAAPAAAGHGPPARELRRRLPEHLRRAGRAGAAPSGPAHRLPGALQSCRARGGHAYAGRHGQHPPHRSAGLCGLRLVHAAGPHHPDRFRRRAGGSTLPGQARAGDARCDRAARGRIGRHRAAGGHAARAHRGRGEPPADR